MVDSGRHRVVVPSGRPAYIYVVWRAGTTTPCQGRLYPPVRDWEFGHWWGSAACSPVGKQSYTWPSSSCKSSRGGAVSVWWKKQAQGGNCSWPVCLSACLPVCLSACLPLKPLPTGYTPLRLYSPPCGIVDRGPFLFLFQTMSSPFYTHSGACVIR
jgi:hypothetical protein